MQAPTLDAAKQTEDTVLWSAVLARARRDGDRDRVTEAVRQLATLGLHIQVDEPASAGGDGDA